MSEPRCEEHQNEHVAVPGCVGCVMVRIEEQIAASLFPEKPLSPIDSTRRFAGQMFPDSFVQVLDRGDGTVHCSIETHSGTDDYDRLRLEEQDD